MTQTVIYLGGKNSPILYPAVLKDGWQRGWLNASLAAVGAATGSWADDPVDVATRSIRLEAVRCTFLLDGCI